jgi:hypothetical protein
VRAQPKKNEIKRPPPEGLLKVTSKRLFTEGAVARHVRKIDPTTHRNHDVEQLLEESAPPHPNKGYLI